MSGIWMRNRGQILVALTAATLILGIAGMMTRELTRNRNDAVIAAHRDAANLVRVVENHVLRTVSDVDRTLKLLREDWLEGRDRFDRTARLLQQDSADDLLLQFSVIDADGRLAYSNLKEPEEPVDLSDRDHFRVHREAAEDNLFISKPIMGRVSGKWSIQLTRRITDREGKFAGVVVASVDPHYFSQRFGEVDLGKKGTVSLIGFDRVIRARGGGLPVQHGPQLGMEIKWPVPPETQKLTAGVVSAPGPVDGLPRLFAFRRVGAYPLVVAIGLSEEEVFAATDAWEQGHRIWGYSIVCIIVVAAATLAWSLRREERAKAALQRLATTDPLTGVWNRRHFFELIERELERARRYERPLSILMLDADHFKRINDDFGHQVGDQVLLALVAACRDVLRESDVLARLGGEEFGVLLPETPGAGAAEVAERLRAAATSIALGRPEGLVRCTISVGIAEFAEWEDLGGAVARADRALYVAKHSGRNRCHLAPPAACG